MSIPSMQPDEIRAAAAIHQELGPDYQGAVIESFLDKVGKEIDARVDARLAHARQDPPNAPVPVQAHSRLLWLAIASIALGIPLSGIAAASHTGDGGLAIIWLAIALINVAYAVSFRRPPGSGHPQR